MKKKLFALALIVALVLCAFPILTAAETSVTADYTEVDKAVASVEKLDEALYTDFSGVKAAVTAVVRDLPAEKQTEVDAMAKAINDAVVGLELLADYTEVDAILAKVAAMNKSYYEDFSKVDAAVAKVVRGKGVSQQAAVDFMADAIESAIGFLEMKPADYTAVNAAVAAAEKLDKSSYKDFSEVEAAIAAVVTGKNIDEQAAVDAMAKAITDAVDGLESINPETSDAQIVGVALLAVAAAVTGFCIVRKRKA